MNNLSAQCHALALQWFSYSYKYISKPIKIKIVRKHVALIYHKLCGVDGLKYILFSAIEVVHLVLLVHVFVAHDVIHKIWMAKLIYILM